MQFQNYGQQVYGNQFGNFGDRALICQLCGGNHSSFNCQVGNHFAPEDSYENFSWQNNYPPNTYDSGWNVQQDCSWYGTSNFPQYKERSPLDEAMERMQEAHAELHAYFEKSSQELDASVRNTEMYLEQIMEALSQGNQGDLQNNMEITYNEQVEELNHFQEPSNEEKWFEEDEDEPLRSAMEQEISILENFEGEAAYHEEYIPEKASHCTIVNSNEISNFPLNFFQEGLEDHQEDTSRSQTSQELTKLEENKTMTAHHESHPLKETEFQLFKPKVEFSRNQDAYSSLQPTIEAQCTLKEANMSMIIPQGVHPAVASIFENYLVRDVKSFQGFHSYASLPYLKFGNYYKDDIIYIYDPG